MSMAISGTKDKSPASSPALIGSSGDSMRETFGVTLTQLAERYPNVVVLDADVAGGTGAHHFRKAYPERFYQFGISEQNMMSAAGGMASTGLIPVITVFAVFCLRAYEQARLSVAYCNRNVKIVASHPGLDVGPDGGSAQTLEDIAVFRAIPGMTVISPADPIEMELATEAILKFDGPVYMRTGRSPIRRVLADDYKFEIGKGRVLRDGLDVSIVACGVEVARALDAAEMLSKEGISARVVNISTIKPLDVELLVCCAKETGAVVTAEDHNIIGGLADAVCHTLVTHQISKPFKAIAVRDHFAETGSGSELYEKYGLSSNHMIKAVKDTLTLKKAK